MLFVVGRRASLLTLSAPRRLSGGPLRARVATRGRVRWLRAWLNGRRIDDAVTPQPLRGALDRASHGLRHGANRLKVIAIRESGKYDVERRRISVTRDRPLAAAGKDRRSGGGRRVLLDARRSLAAAGAD